MSQEAPPPVNQRELTALDRWFQRVFGDDEPSHLGTGWVSGATSVACGVLGLLAVFCFLFPEILTAPQLRARYPIPLLRAVLQTVLVVSIGLGLVSLALRKRKVLGLVGIGLSLGALALGGGAVPLPDSVESRFGLGLEWLVLNALLLGLLFIPLERALPLKREQPLFRPGWTTDALHFGVSHLLVQLFAYAALAPAFWVRSAVWPDEGFRGLAAWPLPLQFGAVMVLADLTQYAVHNAFHRVPWLWRFHAIHHSATAMDWLAGSRLHPLDALCTRAAVMVVLVTAGASATAIGLYLAFVSFHAVFIHANFAARLEWLEPFLVTPRIHHFHHADEPEAIDKNFAVHLPVLDRVFGTRFAPRGRWPKAYGVQGGGVPESYVAQGIFPFRR
jgi:sterol desaturase/sphingolipid hydroxylase (fatty acid hydroxylase superfamily)